MDYFAIPILGVTRTTRVRLENSLQIFILFHNVRQNSHLRQILFPNVEISSKKIFFKNSSKIRRITRNIIKKESMIEVNR